MHRTRVSSKGQVVIPKKIRDELCIETGTLIRLKVIERKLILEPVKAFPSQTLYGKYRGAQLLQNLEDEHEAEIEKEFHS